MAIRSKRRKKRKLTIAERVRRDFRSFLVKTGLLEPFQSLPPGIRTEIFLNRCPPPAVVLEESAQDDPDAASFPKSIQKMLRNVYVKSPSLDMAFSIRTVFSAMWTLFGASEHYMPELPDHPGLSRIHKVCHLIADEVYYDSSVLIGFCVDDVLTERMRLDRKLFYHITTDVKRPGKSDQIIIRIFKTEPQSIRLGSPGGDSRAFRCGSTFYSRKIDWVKWKMIETGVGMSQATHSVYIHAHALRRLFQRIPVAQTETLADCLYGSLSEPKFVHSRNGQMLVEYRLRDKPMGYLPVEFFDGRYLLRTFLFLTMDGTPEGQRLRERFSIRRHGIETMRLDKLESFLLSDLKEDSELVQILSDCGCGHLLDMAKTIEPDDRLKSVARDMRRYLGMPLPLYDSLMKSSNANRSDTGGPMEGSRADWWSSRHRLASDSRRESG